MKSQAQIVWETKRDVYNRLWDTAFSKDLHPLEGARLLLKELGKIKEELEAEVKE